MVIFWKEVEGSWRATTLQDTVQPVENSVVNLMPVCDKSPLRAIPDTAGQGMLDWRSQAWPASWLPLSPAAVLSLPPWVL